MFELRETGDWDIFPGPPERARAETGGADQWGLKRRECSGFVTVNKVTSASLGYPLSVFNKNSTLKATHTPRNHKGDSGRFLCRVRQLRGFYVPEGCIEHQSTPRRWGEWDHRGTIEEVAILLVLW